MRWKYHRDGDTRVRFKFCWFPVRWDGITYWFETVNVTEKYISNWWDGNYWSIRCLTSIDKGE